MRVVFFGTSAFAVPALDALAGSRHELPAAVCPPPAPAGRGRRLVPCPVEARARERGIPVLDPGDPNDPGFVDQLAELEPDACLLASYGSILGPALLELPKHGFINIHPSLLPRFRGAAPVLRCLLAGDTHTGVCVIRLTGRVDAGPVLARRKTAVGPDENRGELEARLALLGAELAVDVLDQLEAGTARPRPQEDAEATPAPKLRPAERRLDWARSARRLHDQVRALAPEPGAWAVLR
ncbi:methionyl-tRNA formyltransferase, partial [candidate division WOR-3 bacterium]|nr:methionyl-tRNA formyltransferase [candidate division WOR-3 bacterium]